MAVVEEESVGEALMEGLPLAAPLDEREAPRRGEGVAPPCGLCVAPSACELEASGEGVGGVEAVGDALEVAQVLGEASPEALSVPVAVAVEQGDRLTVALAAPLVVTLSVTVAVAAAVEVGVGVLLAEAVEEGERGGESVPLALPLPVARALALAEKEAEEVALGESVLVAVTLALAEVAALAVLLPLAVAAALGLLVPVLLALSVPTAPPPPPPPPPVVPEMLGVPEWLALGLPVAEAPPGERLAAALPESVRVGTLVREALCVRLALRLTVVRGLSEGERLALPLGECESLASCEREGLPLVE